MKNIVLLLTFTTLCTTLICPRHSSAQHFVDGQMPDTFLAAHEKSQVSSVVFSPDGKTIAGGSKDEIKLWDVATGTLKATLEGHGDSVSSVAFSPDGKSLASGSADRTVRLWDVTRQPKTPKATLSDHGNKVYAVAFSSDGTRLASGSADGRVRLWTALPPANNDGS